MERINDLLVVRTSNLFNLIDNIVNYPTTHRGHILYQGLIY